MDSVEQGAFENACDCLYYGYGKKYWLDMGWNMGLSKEKSDEIWQKAFEKMSEDI